MKKIVLFTRSFGRGGTDKVISLIGNELSSDYEIHIVVAGEYDKDAYKLERRIMVSQLKGVHSDKNKYLKFFVLCRDYVLLMREIQPDMVISFLPQPCIIASLMKASVNALLICAERSNPYLHYRGELKIVVNFLFSRADAVVFQSVGAMDFFSEKVRKKALIIGNPICSEVRAVEPFWGKIVAVGRHAPEKNYYLLIRAFDIVQKKIPGAKLEIYGRFDGALDVRKLIENLYLTDKVSLKGQVDDVPMHIKDAEVYVLSSKSEGMPNALMEAMAMGLPCVATDCPAGGVRELIRNNENGILVRNDDAEELAEGIMALMGDREKAKRLGNEARKITDRFGQDRVISEWRGLIEKFTGAGK